MANVFFRDWQAGDVVTAADMQDLAAAVGMLENSLMSGSAAAAGDGGAHRESDGPVYWPWQVVCRVASTGRELWVQPGRVLADVAWQPVYDAMNSTYEPIKVDGFDAEASTPQVVWLEYVREHTAVDLRWEDMPESGQSGVSQYEALRLADAARWALHCLPVGEVPPATAYGRLWALAVYTAGHEQAVNQLVWGDLSALECRGVCDAAGVVLWPTDRSAAASWGSTGHEAGMAVITAVEASTPKEAINGTLMGCLDVDGALEFYLGYPERPQQPEDYTGGEENDKVFDDVDDDPGGDDYVPPGDDNDDEEEEEDDDTVITVKYGYEAGEGFSGCTLVKKSGKWYWKLTLDAAYINEVLTALEVPAQLTLKASGTSPGIYAGVTMTLGASSGAFGAGACTGSGGLLFKGTAGSTGVASRTHQGKYLISASISASKTWYLSPTVKSTAGAWVKCTDQAGGRRFSVQATAWRRFDVDRATLRQVAINTAKKYANARAVSDTDTSSSADSTVTGTLSGTLINITANAVLS